jgi:uncharacterized protein (DUF2235 family)
MAKKIVLFSDGTGNSSAKAQKTNVWRLFQALDQTRPEQIAKYDNGVGTSSNKYLAAIGGAFGWGLKRIVIDLYKFVCRNYENGDHIYAFGFSRGSFTIRVLVDFIATEGLVTYRSEEELNRNAAAAYRHYRSEKFWSWSPFVLPMRWLRDVVLWVKDRIKGYRTYREVVQRTQAAGRAEIPIRFLGLWDTVEAYGMPVEELKRGIDWVLWPMVFGDLILSPRVQRACHALSLDDERTTFHPLLWDEVAEADMVAKHQVAAGRITQVWFAGVHSNVGGGYPEDQLSLVSLDWMMGEAIHNDLILDSQAVTQVAAAKSPYARLYDSRAGIASYYRYAPRQIHVLKDEQDNRILPIIHGSVVMRMAYGSDRYSPISLPHEFWVLAPDGELLAMEGAPLTLKLDTTKKQDAGARPATKTSNAIDADKAQLIEAIQRLARPDRQAVRLVWDTVFWRRSLYFLTFALTLILAAYPLLSGLFSDTARRLVSSIPLVGGDLQARWGHLSSQLNDGSRGPITSIVDALSGFIPNYAKPWTEALQQHPLEFGLIVVAIIVGLAGSKILEGRIRDRARLAWHRTFRQGYAEWCKESQKGWRNGVLVALVVAVVGLVVAFMRGMTVLIKLELGILVMVLVALLVLRTLGQRPVAQSQTTPIQGTFALSVARFLRNNRLLQGIHKWGFQVAVPIVFALLLVAAGWGVANHALFEVASASGHFCKGSVAADERRGEKIGASSGSFQTDKMCWASGLVLEEGRRYRITLATQGDWFDRTTRGDVGGFPAANFRQVSATLLKPWWRENWFKPVARIGEIGNDDYVMAPVDEPRQYKYPDCSAIERATDGSGVRAKIRQDVAQELVACAPTPDDRKVVTTEIKARTTGELFLYVNDAVLMWPGSTDLFYDNNTGTAMLTVERITAAPPASRAKAHEIDGDKRDILTFSQP